MGVGFGKDNLSSGHFASRAPLIGGVLREVAGRYSPDFVFQHFADADIGERAKILSAAKAMSILCITSPKI
ncbi:hypothetical protein D9M68_946890 [compost metagenome]